MNCPKCGATMVEQHRIGDDPELVCFSCRDKPKKKPRKRRACQHTRVAKADMGTVHLTTPQNFVWVVDAVCLSCGAWDLSSEYDERWHGWHHPRELAALDEVEVGS